MIRSLRQTGFDSFLSSLDRKEMYLTLKKYRLPHFRCMGISMQRNGLNEDVLGKKIGLYKYHTKLKLQ